MKMQRIDFDDFVYEHDCTYTYKGQPFTGVACDYFPNGSLQSEAQFVNGHQEGMAREWYENGRLKFEGEYLGDGFHGISKEWHANGQLKKASAYEYSICLESEEWDENGRLVREFRLQPTDMAYEYLEKRRLLWGRKDAQ
jgi:antitoxin component YwqK of YwqJK toxin-antitoxin module